jgi:hypothetical protein
MPESGRKEGLHYQLAFLMGCSEVHPGPAPQSRGRTPGLGMVLSNLRHGDRLFFADLKTTFAAETFLPIDRFRFLIYNLVHVYRANLHALATANTLFLIHFHIV